MKFAVLFACVAFAAPALAQQATPPAADAKPVEEKKICRRLEATGTILGIKRECHTKEEWAKISEATGDRARRAMDDRQLGGNRSMQ